MEHIELLKQLAETAKRFRSETESTDGLLILNDGAVIQNDAKTLISLYDDVIALAEQSIHRLSNFCSSS